MTPSEEVNLCDKEHVASSDGVVNRYLCNRLKDHDGNHYFVEVNSGA